MSRTFFGLGVGLVRIREWVSWESQGQRAQGEPGFDYLWCRVKLLTHKGLGFWSLAMCWAPPPSPHLTRTYSLALEPTLAQAAQHHSTPLSHALDMTVYDTT